MTKSYVFLEGKPFEGISKKTERHFVLRKLRFADPLTFENHQLDFSEKLDTIINTFEKGEKFTYEYELNSPSFGNSDSRLVVTSLKRV